MNTQQADTYTAVQREFLSHSCSRIVALDRLLFLGLRTPDAVLLLNKWEAERPPLSVLHVEDLDPSKEDTISRRSNLYKE